MDARIDFGKFVEDFVEAFLVTNIAIPEPNPVLPAFSQFLSDQFPDPPQAFLRRVVEVVDDDHLVLVVRNPQQFEAGVRSDVSRSARHQDRPLGTRRHGQSQNDRRPGSQQCNGGQEAAGAATAAAAAAEMEILQSVHASSTVR
eukprot:CAMPEP_0168228938 /NCGR_PEP_ID=MMETSP0140_2-20121125/14983_1 /TAXON_ID=44445 /ORGANISM="Pseudo-nitzschia australis, Strain 10249 10 AB" /LENGTH=143 /DNA_ID=CAMNT_0008160665 /DNA_START=1705 /DNA_END=2136 /DNA_ORIENTATION=+